MAQTRIEYLLSSLSEECGEVVQAIDKIQRFADPNTGEVIVPPEDPESGDAFDLLSREMEDVLAIIELLETENPDWLTDSPHGVMAKKRKVDNYWNKLQEIQK